MSPITVKLNIPSQRIQIRSPIKIKIKNNKGTVSKPVHVGGLSHGSPVNIKIKTKINIKPNINHRPTTKIIINGLGNAVDKRTTKYSQSTQQDHILNRPENYTGSIYKNSRPARLLDMSNPEKPCFSEREIDLPEAMDDLFREILSNAGDNVHRSRLKNVPFTYIDVKVDKKRVVIENDGLVIPISIHPQTKVWTPEMLFGMFRTSENYDDSKLRTVGGRNGAGAKITNVFSTFFMVEVGDPQTKRYYKQIWRNNLYVREEPIIEENYDGKPFVRVSYDLDFKRFGYTEYPDEAILLFGAYAADASFTSRAPVRFNGHTFDIKTIYDFSSWFFKNEIERRSTICHYEWPSGTDIIVGNGVQYLADKTQPIIPDVEILLLDTPDAGKVYAFSNGIPNRDGGIHSKAGIQAISNFILPKINGSKKKKKNNKNDINNRKNNPKLTLADVRPHISIIINVRVDKPTFNNQAKCKLTGYIKNNRPAKEMKFNLANIQLRRVSNWKLIRRLENALRAKNLRRMKETDGRKTQNISINDVSDAGLAGGSRSKETVLILSEGKSAKAYVTSWISEMGGTGNDYYGSMPLRGKPLNIMNAKVDRIINNREIALLKQVLGLRECENEEDRGDYYLNEDNFNTLRYGRVLIFADSDVDGKHIVGLILLLFHCLYPSLLKREYIMFYRTPLLRAIKGKQRLPFMTRDSYDRWLAEDPRRKNWEVKYFKGLGTSTPQDVKDDFKNPHMVRFIYDQHAPGWIRTAFGKDVCNTRKKWIELFKPQKGIELVKELPISTFIGAEMGEHPIANLARSISGLDGLKVSQRKVIWACMLKWKGKYGDRAKAMKTARLASNVAEVTDYHHGPKSMDETITLMAQDFAGANNLPYLCPEGQFGTRNMNGKDASNARYTFTKPQWWWNLIFRPEDQQILDHVVDEGKQLEPISFYPIIPMCLVNGCRGIATGYSTFIPQHNPLDVCKWLVERLSSPKYILPKTTLIPWYRDFNGEITMKLKKRKIILTVPSNPPSPSNSPTPSPSNSPTPSPSNSPSPSNPPSPFNKTEGTDDELDDEDEYDTETLMGKDDIIFPDRPMNTLNKPIKTINLPSHQFLVVGKMYKNKGFNRRGDMIKKKGSVVVMELPIGRAFLGYENWLKELRIEKKIQKYRKLTTIKIPQFEITGMHYPTLRKLRLIRTFSLTNMVLLNNDRKPIYFSNIYEILEHYYSFRLETYTKRKEHILKTLHQELTLLNTKLEVINAIVVTRKIIVYDYEKRKPIKKSTILEKMSTDGYSEMHQTIYKKMLVVHMSEEEIQRLERRIKEEQIKITTVQKSNTRNVWKQEIMEFVKAYCKHYKIVNPFNRPSLPTVRIVIKSPN